MDNEDDPGRDLLGYVTKQFNECKLRGCVREHADSLRPALQAALAMETDEMTRRSLGELLAEMDELAGPSDSFG